MQASAEEGFSSFSVSKSVAIKQGISRDTINKRAYSCLVRTFLLTSSRYGSFLVNIQ